MWVSTVYKQLTSQTILGKWSTIDKEIDWIIILNAACLKKLYCMKFPKQPVISLITLNTDLVKFKIVVFAYEIIVF